MSSWYSVREFADSLVASMISAAALLWAAAADVPGAGASS